MKISELILELQIVDRNSEEMYMLLKYLKDRFSEVSVFDLQRYFGRTDFENMIEQVLKKVKGEKENL